MENYLAEIAKLTKSDKAYQIEQIQSLWSGYGKIVRVGLKGGALKSVIAKHTVLPNNVSHPRGWNTDTSHQRKVKSYQVEVNWYKNYSDYCNDDCRVPKCYGEKTVGGEQLIVLEDMDTLGYFVRKSYLTIDETKRCLKWLANFHAKFMGQQPDGLWQVGTYWHLATRPDELKVMGNCELKESAAKIDNLLNSCIYKTLVHGDAKVANFCFNDEENKVAAVDFQYVGRGCGIKDVAYLLGSCLTDVECQNHEEELLHYYFNELEITLSKYFSKLNINELKNEWSCLYAIAWADFIRFMMGWMPTHHKVNNYSEKLVKKALASI
ncbi:MAG: DUF1679 domain-containing protein [Vicingaceae bacterium]|nr:DUF1679 domain-containing protein [Vicingaceae bacterium]